MMEVIKVVLRFIIDLVLLFVAYIEYKYHQMKIEKCIKKIREDQYDSSDN